MVIADVDPDVQILACVFSVHVPEIKETPWLPFPDFPYVVLQQHSILARTGV